MPIVHEHRLTDLRDVVAPGRLRRVWKSTVRHGLRNQAAPDLHDYLDVHWDVDPFCDNLRRSVLAGAYRPREPDVIATEKGKGLLRHLLIPAAADALLLQSLADMLEPAILRNRPSRKAFYSRSHQRPDVENLFTRTTYPWWVNWSRFVSDIWEFRRQFPFVVVTDVTNYFDNIDINLLRNRLASFARIKEAHLDLLLYILDNIKAHGFYGSRSNLALPQIDFDAPRLLATAYLFEADRLLKRRTKSCFVRWMDDIDFGVVSAERAHMIIGELDRCLHGLNVRLNSGKTQVLSAREAEQYFWITENLKINRIRKRVETHRDKPHTRRWKQVVRGLEKSALAFVRKVKVAKHRHGHWEKVYKRYVGLLSAVRSPALESEVAGVLLQRPAMRLKVIGYLRALGFSPVRLRMLREFLRNRAQTDHVACCEAAEVITQWRIPTMSSRILESLVRPLESPGHASPAVFAAGLTMLAKYGPSRRVAAYIRSNEKSWIHSAWGLRQVVACLPLLDQMDAEWVRGHAIRSGAPDAVRILVNLDRLGKASSLDRQVRLYVEHHKDSPYGYPVQKFIILAALMTGKLPSAAKKRLAASVGAKVADPVYTSRLAALAAAA